MRFINKYTLLVIAIIGLLALYGCNPTQYWFWPKCPIKLLTGLSCPACGIQRFLHAALNGQLARACQYNYYLLYSLPYALIVAIAYYLPDSPFKQRLKDVFEGTMAIRLYVGSFLLWFVIRNILNI